MPAGPLENTEVDDNWYQPFIYLHGYIECAYSVNISIQ